MLDKKDNLLAIIGIIFFCALVVIVRINPVKENNYTEADRSSDVVENENSGSETDNNTDDDIDEEVSIFNLIMKGNYHYIYNVKYQQQTEIIEGNSNGNKEIFSILGTTKERYAKVGTDYLKYENGAYKVIDTDIRDYFSYLDLDSILDILNISVSKKDNDKIKYEVDIIDLLDKYTSVDYDSFYDYASDCIILYCNEDGQVYKLEIDYSNYMTYLNGSSSIFNIVMEFDQFGEIKELEI